MFDEMTLDSEIVTAVLNYFLPLGRWKRTLGIASLPNFERFDGNDVRAIIYALDALQILEKHPFSERKNALYRLNKENLGLWHEMLGTIIIGQSVLPKIPLGTLAVLYVVGKFQVEQHRPPKQTELVFRDMNKRNLGLVNEYLRESGLLEEVLYEITGPVPLDKAARLLAIYGLMLQRGSRKQRKRYELTEEGLRLYQRLSAHDWREWHSILNSW